MSDTAFRTEHICQLKVAGEQRQRAVGHNVRNWARWVVSHDPGIGARLRPEVLPDGQIERATVFDMVRRTEVSTAECCAAIAAWGSMNRTHGLSAFGALDRWIGVAEDLRRGNLGRREAYESFLSLRPDGLPGIGPAYFTKFIFFLMPGGSRRGYIMDQWTGRSINLLLESGPLVAFDRHAKPPRVSDSNAPETYESFCNAIEQLGVVLRCSPEVAEERIFSEGRGRGPWRTYLRRADGLG